ncbi:hypothetical protein V6N13_066538 [Hibiscus sabdariffa]
MPLKWVFNWQPNAGSTVNSQILNEVSQCVESMNGVKEGRWKATLTFYKPMLRDQALAGEFPREFIGISLPEQPNKYYFILRVNKIVLEADSSIQLIMEKLQSYKSRVALNFEGFQYQLGDFQLRVGKVVPTHSENLRGIVMEVEYLPISSLEKSKLIMDEFVDIWQDAVSKRSLPGHFMHIELNFSDYGLADHYTSQHTAVQYAHVMGQLIATLRFAPKAPPRRAPKLEVKAEVVEDIDVAQAKDLLKRFNQNSVRTKPKVEKKVLPSQVAFGHGAGSASIRTFGSSKGASRGSGETLDGGVRTPGLREGKEYKEPWDYYSYYPVSLPMRRPYSGNPEFLDEEEFALENATYNENSMEPAVELGLMEENLEPTMLFLKLPPILPTIKQAESVAVQQVGSSSKSSRTVKTTSGLAELPAGFMGKMLVYKSGAVKLKLGDTIYNVNPGMNCAFAQDVVAVNPAEKQCGVVGEIDKHAVVTPDVDSVLNSLMSDL